MTNILFAGLGFDDLKRMMELIDLAMADTDEFEVNYNINVHTTESVTAWCIRINDENILTNIINDTVRTLEFDTMCGMITNGITMEIAADNGNIMTFNFDGLHSITFDDIAKVVGV